MKLKLALKSIVLFAALSALSACGDGQPKTVKKGIPANPSGVAHKVSECPAITGHYVPTDGSTLESLDITPTGLGMNVKLTSNHDEYDSVIDGQSRVFTEPVFYSGMCIGGEVYIHFFDVNQKTYAKAFYKLNEKNELVITQQNFDSLVDDNGFPAGVRNWVKKDIEPQQTPN